RTALFTPIDVATLGPVGFAGIGGAAAFGLGITLVAAWRPARQAARFVPAAAARRGATIALREARLPAPGWGLLCFALGIAAGVVALVSGWMAIAPLVDAAFVVGLALLSPSIVRLTMPVVVRLLRPFGVMGEIAT